MSASEIIKQLPKLSEAERRAIREGLLEIANQEADVALCNQAALEGALIDWSSFQLPPAPLAARPALAPPPRPSDL